MTAPREPSLTQISVGITAYRTLAADIPATGVRTHQLRYDNLGADPLGGSARSTTPRVAEEFLVASRLLAHDRESQLSISDYFGDPMATVLSQIDDDPVGEHEAVRLPSRAAAPMALEEAMLRRRSVRRFTGDRLHLPQLAALLRFGDGVTAETDVELLRGGHVSYRFRTVPSGGGLYPIELQVAAFNVDGLTPGLYRYQPVHDVLCRSGGRDVLDRVLNALDAARVVIALDAASAVLLLVARPWRTMRKYGPRGMRFVLHEAGGIAQNVHLAAVALGLGSIDCASFIDDEVHAALDLDGVLAAVVHTIIVGCPE